MAVAAPGTGRRRRGGAKPTPGLARAAGFFDVVSLLILFCSFIIGVLLPVQMKNDVVMKNGLNGAHGVKDFKISKHMSKGGPAPPRANTSPPSPPRVVQDLPKLAHAKKERAKRLLAREDSDSKAALALLRQAAAADPMSSEVFRAHFLALYCHGHDMEAEVALEAFARTHPEHPILTRATLTLRNESADELVLRGVTLYKQHLAMREGRPVGLPYESRIDLSEATAEAFLQALVLRPTVGKLWHDLGAALYFAGEIAEANRVRVHGRSVAASPMHEKLDDAVAKLRAFRYAGDGAEFDVVEESAAAARFVEQHPLNEAELEPHVLPEGGYKFSAEYLDVHRDQPELFGASPTVYVSRSPLLSTEDCAAAIAAAETYAELRGGWAAASRYAAPASDVPLSVLTEVLPQLTDAVRSHIFPAVSGAYPAAAARPGKLRIADGAIVKYEKATQLAGYSAELDQGLLTVVVALNDPVEYDGGGMWFRALGRAVDGPGAGHALLYPAALAHASQSISRGTRYVLVLFCAYDDNVSGRPEGWVLQRYRELSYPASY